MINIFKFIWTKTLQFLFAKQIMVYFACNFPLHKIVHPPLKHKAFLFNSITLFCASLSLLLKINAERNHAVQSTGFRLSLSLRVQKSPTRWHLRVLLRDRVLFSKHRAANNNNKLVRRANVKGTSSLFHYLERERQRDRPALKQERNESCFKRALVCAIEDSSSLWMK